MTNLNRQQFGSIPDSQRYPPVNMEDPAVYRRAVSNIHAVHQLGSPEAQRQGDEFYDRAHDLVSRSIRHTGLSHWQGSGLMAAASPGMDYGSNNVHAIRELSGLKRQHWDTINQSALNKIHSPTEDNPNRMVHARTGEADSVLRGMAISRAPDSQLLKAHKILLGGDPETVLNRRTSPKTNSFAHNIEEPDSEGDTEPVTVDGRAHDIGVNRLQPWTYSGRGISSAGLKSGKPTRYEHFERAYRDAGQLAGGRSGKKMQAGTWFAGKELELAAPTKNGQPRVKGPGRLGQPYL